MSPRDVARRGFARALATALTIGSIAAGFAACQAELGPLPAKCSSAGDPVCPEGYECIHGVCAEPGTAIPSTITTLQYLRPVDLRMIPQESGALVAWQLYKYDLELHDFAGARLSPDGSASPEMTLVAEYPANANYLEPYFDLLAIDDRELLLSVGAAPADTAPESRLTQFAVHLPAPGDEAAGATSDQVWELRMRTLGYGAVSRPRLARSGDDVALAYFESEAEGEVTRGDLATFRLATDGSRIDPPACPDSSCCQSNGCFAARVDGSVAVGLVDAFVEGDDVWWIVDDTRPSFVRLGFDASTPPDAGNGGGGEGGGDGTGGDGSGGIAIDNRGGVGGSGGAGPTGSGGGGGGDGGGASGSGGEASGSGGDEAASSTASSSAATTGSGGGEPVDPDAPPQGDLPRLAVPVYAKDGTLVFLQPSKRGGAGLADDPVTGGATLWKVTLDESGAPGQPAKISDLPEIRDTPRPVWIAREGKPSLLVTPGVAIESKAIRVFEVDDAGQATEVASIDRLAELPIAVVQAVVVGGKLYVAWVDESADSASIRAAVLPEP